MDGFVSINNLVCQWNGECNGFEQQLQGEKFRERERERERGPVRHGEITPARYRTTLRK